MQLIPSLSHTNLFCTNCFNFQHAARSNKASTLDASWGAPVIQTNVRPAKRAHAATRSKRTQGLRTSHPHLNSPPGRPPCHERSCADLSGSQTQLLVWHLLHDLELLLRDDVPKVHDVHSKSVRVQYEGLTSWSKLQKVPRSCPCQGTLNAMCSSIFRYCSCLSPPER